MKKLILMLGIVVLLICVGLSGCEEFKEDLGSDFLDAPYEDSYEVTVQPTAYVKTYNYSTHQHEPVANQTVTFEILKTSGKTYILTGITDENGIAECPEVHYTLYLNQTISIYYSIDGSSDSDSVTYIGIYEKYITESISYTPRGELIIE